VDEVAGRHLVSRMLELGRLGEFGEPARVRLHDVRTNGRRVDARLVAADGSDHLVVLWVAEGNPSDIESVTVSSRPLPFSGRPGGLVVLVNGPSSAGKSSLMRAFADREDSPFSVLDEPWFGRLPARFLAWPESLGPHVAGVLAGVAASARLGNQFLMSAAGIAQAAFRAALTGVDVVYVGVDAPLEVLVERQLTQADKFGRLAEESVGIHQGWTYDLWIDTSEHTPDAAALILSDLLRNRTRSAR
jgi:chloramphenicol 3-O phosphotransferase